MPFESTWPRYVKRRVVPAVSAILLAACLVGCSASAADQPDRMERIAVSPDRTGFVQVPSSRRFVPWGFNYDHDENGRLLEEYWISEWSKVDRDFREMKALGANTIRIHLQFGRFMQDPDTPDPPALAQLERLVGLAERLRLYLDVTGLGCYLARDVPPWYDQLSERGRWDAQRVFWTAISRRCAESPAVFCYDLMNEPVVPDSPREPGAWLGPPFAGRFHYVQFITLDPADRPRPEIARHWLHELTTAIRAHDPTRLVTVGLVPWSLDRPGLTSGFVPERIAPELDFLCVHLYPKSGQLDEAVDTLKGFDVGKPVLIEETFPLRCSASELRRFMHDSRPVAAGWLGFYWGETLEQCRESGTMAGAITTAWLELFREGPPKSGG